MKLSSMELKFKELVQKLPSDLRFDFTPTLQKVDELTLGCQMKVELIDTGSQGNLITQKKVTVFALGKNALEAQYLALRLALVQLNLL